MDDTLKILIAKSLDSIQINFVPNILIRLEIEVDWLRKIQLDGIFAGIFVYKINTPLYLLIGCHLYIELIYVLVNELLQHFEDEARETE